MILAGLLVGVALGERLVWDLGPNVELVTMAAVAAGMYLPKKYGWAVPLVIMMVSDWVLGWGVISVFTWSGFVAMVGLPGVLKRFSRRNWLVGGVSGVVGVVGFYLWTNLGVWLTDVWGMYPKSGAGLVQAYVNGLPFLRAQLVSALWFVPMGVVVIGKVAEWLETKGDLVKRVQLWDDGRSVPAKFGRLGNSR